MIPPTCIMSLTRYGEILTSAVDARAGKPAPRHRAGADAIPPPVNVRPTKATVRAASTPSFSRNRKRNPASVPLRRPPPSPRPRGRDVDEQECSGGDEEGRAVDHEREFGRPEQGSRTA
jgi:hypothetical protein